MKELWADYKFYCMRNNYKLNITDRRFYMLISQIIIADVNKEPETEDEFKKKKVTQYGKNEKIL